MNKNESLYRKTYEKLENLSSYAVQFRTKEMEKIFYSPWKKNVASVRQNSARHLLAID